MTIYRTDYIFVIGGDGYIGWPLAINLALKYPKHQVLILDNFLRRRLVDQVGSNSIVPIETIDKRIAAFEAEFGQNNLEYIEYDLTKPGIEELLAEKKPSLIYHLGQQPSAHYSMKGVDEATFTLRNNEEGNLRLLWAMHDVLPDSHLVKLGSFGEYAKCGLDIAEGYFQPEYKGRLADKKTPFPREYDDIYHFQTVQDSNFISMACRKWQLRITDIMQATIFGTYTKSAPTLYSRFDYDEYFGTVINRFIAQAVTGLPLTIYGTGHQRTGLMALEDAISSLTQVCESTPEKGQHQVINHVVEKRFCINELAEIVKTEAHALGLNVEISRGDYNPREENLQHKEDYNIESEYLKQHELATHSISNVVKETLGIIEKFADRINQQVIAPSFSWKNGPQQVHSNR